MATVSASQSNATTDSVTISYSIDNAGNGDMWSIALYDGTATADSIMQTDDGTLSSSSLSDTHTFTGLDPDSYYEVGFGVTTVSSGTGSDNVYIDTYTDPTPSPYINISVANTTTSTVSVESTFSSNYYDTDRVIFEMYDNSSESNLLKSGYANVSPTTGDSDNGMTIDGLSDDTTYYFKVIYEDADSNKTWSDGVHATTDEITNPRPSNFSWTSSKVQGRDFNLTAIEWNNFTDRINEFRNYKGLSSYSFSNAYSGIDFTADKFNEARIAINDMNPSTSAPSRVYTGDTVTAYIMNRIVDALNSIS